MSSSQEHPFTTEVTCRVKELGYTMEELSHSTCDLSQIHDTVDRCATGDITPTNLEIELETQSIDREYRHGLDEPMPRDTSDKAGDPLFNNAQEWEVKYLQEGPLSPTVKSLESTIEELTLRARVRGSYVGGQSEGIHVNRFSPLSYEGMEPRNKKDIKCDENKYTNMDCVKSQEVNSYLHHLLKKQEESIDTVLMRCRQLEAANDLMEWKMKQNNDQIELIRGDQTKLLTTQTQNQQQVNELKRRNIDSASLELLFVEYNECKRNLVKKEEKCRKLTREANRWQNRAMQLTHILRDDEREAGKRKILKLQAMGDNIEMNAIRASYKEKIQAKAIARQRQGASAFRRINGEVNAGVTQYTTGRDIISNNNQRSSTQLTHPIDALEISASEILAMWNANYQQQCHHKTMSTVSSLPEIPLHVNNNNNTMDETINHQQFNSYFQVNSDDSSSPSKYSHMHDFHDYNTVPHSPVAEKINTKRDTSTERKGYFTPVSPYLFQSYTNMNGAKCSNSAKRSISKEYNSVPLSRLTTVTVSPREETSAKDNHMSIVTCNRICGSITPAVLSRAKRYFAVPSLRKELRCKYKLQNENSNKHSGISISVVPPPGPFFPKL
eukprot:Tbor_TRINITY_DN4793_c0_g1::TRINITY_DN4793_c0_g1_i1::g.17004::m.17004